MPSPQPNPPPLRPFCLEAALHGDPIIWMTDTTARFICRSTHNNPHQPNIIEHSGGLSYVNDAELFMVPLAYIDHAPVYRGDKLWNKIDGRQYTITGLRDNNAFNTDEPRIDGWHRLCHEDATLTPPTRKREGWINISAWNPSHCVTNGSTVSAVVSNAYISQQHADKDPDFYGPRIACLRIEWEEPTQGGA